MEVGAFLCSLVVLLLFYTSHSENTPPKITEPKARSLQYVKHKANVTLVCQAESIPSSTYRWTYWNQVINEDGFTLKDATVDKTTGTLSITFDGDDHEGNYQCLAGNEIKKGVEAVAMSAVITLRAVELSVLEWPAGDNTAIKPLQWDYMALTCDNPPKCVPEPQFSWYRSEPADTSVRSSSKGEVKGEDRIYLDANGTLHFIYVKTEDSSKDLRYKCGVMNSILNLIRLGSEKIVEVKPVAGAIGYSEPTFRSSSFNAKFYEREDAVLECIFSGYPVPTVKWKNQQMKDITNDEKFIIVSGMKGRKLIIKDVRWEDSGSYTCEATNTMNDQSPVKRSVFLNVVSGPIWVAAISSQIVPENKDAVFTCKARAINVDDQLNAPTWYMNGKEFKPINEPRFEFSDNLRVLTVKNLNKTTDFMCFQCNVSNEYGSEFSDGCLTVIEPIVITTQPELEQHIARGDQVNLTIIGKTDPAYTLEYRWYFKNRTYGSDESPPFVYYNQTTKQAYINTSGLSDDDYWNLNGTYIRELYHPHDRLNVSIDVILKELPPPAAVVAAGADLWWIALIVALIVLIIVIILIVIICNRMRQEGTYPLDKKERSNDIDPEKDLADSGFQDLSRAPGDDDYPTKKSSAINPNFDYGDDIDDMGDDDESLMEYGGADFDTTKFNEDGSFIGQYTSKNKTPEVKHNPMPLNHQATESQI